MDTEMAGAYIPRILERLAPIRPYKVILFGSRAYGTPDKDSDIDLMIVLDTEEMPQTFREKQQVYLQVSRLLRDLRSEIAIDLIVHTRPMHTRFMELDSLFAREILQKGIVLYEGHNS